MIHRRKRRDELVEELGEELVEWGERLASVMEELLPEGDKPPLDDAITSKSRLTGAPVSSGTVKPEREHRDHNGNLMKCMICGSSMTVDGKKCRRHYG